MKDKKPFISYALAAIAGICFIQGLAILSYEGSAHNESTRGNITDVR